MTQRERVKERVRERERERERERFVTDGSSLMFREQWNKLTN